VDTAVGSSVLIRGFRLALTVEGLKPHTVDNYVRDVERFALHHSDLFQATSADVRAYILTLQERRSPKRPGLATREVQPSGYGRVSR